MTHSRAISRTPQPQKTRIFGCFVRHGAWSSRERRAGTLRRGSDAQRPKGDHMKTFIATVLGVIAVGVLLIAYGLLSPRAAAAPGDAYQLARPTNGLAQPVALGDDLSAASTPQLQLRCEPGQRAVIRQVNGSSLGACVDGPSGYD